MIEGERGRDWKIGLLDTIADNASSGGVVLGSTPSALSAVDLRLVGCTFHRNGQVVGTGAGGAVHGYVGMWGSPTSMTARVCPAKLCRRRTMNHPMVAAMTATIVPARKALTMNG